VLTGLSEQLDELEDSRDSRTDDVEISGGGGGVEYLAGRAVLASLLSERAGLDARNGGGSGGSPQRTALQEAERTYAIALRADAEQRASQVKKHSTVLNDPPATCVLFK